MRTSVDVTKTANLSLHLNSANVTCFPHHVTNESPIGLGLLINLMEKPCNRFFPIN